MTEQTGLATIDNIGLPMFDRARQALAEAKTVDEVKTIRDQAEALRAYLKQQKASQEMQNSCAEIKLRAERRAGDMLATMEKNSGAQGRIQEHLTGGNTVLPPDTTPRLEDLGISKVQSSRWQLEASVPEADFEQYVLEVVSHQVQELTSSGLLDKAKELKRQQAQAERESASDVPLNLPASLSVIHGDMLEAVPALDLFDLVIADPPYNVTEWDWDKIGALDEFLSYTERWLRAIRPVLKPDYHLFWFCSPGYAADVEMVLRRLSYPIKSRIVWHRRNMAKGSDARMRFVDSWEMIFHCGTRELHFTADWDDSRFDVQTVAVPQTNFEDAKLHPTQKPFKLIRWLVEYGSWPGDRVLDPFAGAGTTGAACSDRECVLIERNANYINVIRNRLAIRQGPAA